ncbi:N-alpha-acetyltransferase 25, NatB auxiliary subunit isoform X2 [Dermacentor albipictus]|uniref:N-alpha-acetyltransferase 25, NatB auxiliary subunit isoform X2 n=1 Tax=Dermacentor albipictus TaxID=60249 RepID=UPI0031FD3667
MASMLAARSHADSSINERRLRPVYDYLDNGNHKKALQEAEKLLKKQKDFSCAKALKALALVRLSRSDEALSVLKELQTEAPTDDATLQAMTLCYRELERPELVVEAYERATQKEPQNEELLSHLFMGYVRVGRPREQRRTALALHRLRHKNPYYFWAVMSLVLEADQPATSPAERNTLLLLAQRMVDKFVKERRIEAEAEVQLYLLVLEMQEKYQEALDVLHGPLGESLTSYLDFVHQRKVELLSKLGRWPEVNSVCKSLLLSNPDNWQYYKQYLDSVDKLQASGWTPEETSTDDSDGEELCPAADHTYALALAFIESLKESCKKGGLLRGPCMAHVAVMIGEKASPEVLADLLMDFFKRTSHKPSCLLDLSYLIGLCSFVNEDIVKLVDRMEASLKVALPDSWQRPPDVSAMQRHLTICQLRHYSNDGSHLSLEDRLHVVRELFASYQHGLQFGAELLATDFQPADNYAVLAGCLLLEYWQESGDCSLLLRLLVALEKALLNSPSCFQIKLLLLKIYGRIGSAGPCHHFAELLDIKHVQHDTLGYLVTPVYLKAGHFQAASANMNLSLKLFTGNYKDTTDYLIACYKYGSFTKIQEMMRFRERLNNSLHFALLTVDKMILELLLEAKSQETLKQMLMSMEIDPVNDKMEWSALTDNRDVRIFREWGATRRKLLDEYLERTRQEEVVWLRIRNLLLRLLAACHQLCSQQLLSQPQQQTPLAPAGGDYVGNDSERPLANGERAPSAGGTGGPLAVATSLLDSLHEVALEADALPPHPQPYPVLCPQPGRLGAFVSGGCLRALLAAFQWIVDLYKVNEELSMEAPASAEIKVGDNLVPLVKSVISKVKDLKVDSLQSTNTFLEALSNATEVIGWCSLVAATGSSLARPSRQTVAKKGKKKTKEASFTEEASTKCFVSLVGELELAATDLQAVVAQAPADMLANLMASLNLDHEEPFLQGTEELSKQVRQRIEQSYADSLKELGTMLDSKLKLLQSLRA